jgi:hypothetical protein
MKSNEQFLCVVNDGKLTILLPESNARPVVRLTEMPMQASMPPEAQETSIKKHESKEIMVTGRYGGGWIYSTKMIDIASPILSALVQKMFIKVDSEQSDKT